MKDRELTNYVQKALSAANKKKEPKKEQAKEKATDDEEAELEESEADKKARELAEKYY